jgi:hypothetical protein
LTINEDGSGSIQMTEIRHEPSYMQLVGEQYGRRFYKDSTYVFAEYIEKYNSNFKYTPAEQHFSPCIGRVHIKKSSFDKEYKTTFTYSFEKVCKYSIYIKPKITQMILKIICTHCRETLLSIYL